MPSVNLDLLPFQPQLDNTPLFAPQHHLQHKNLVVDSWRARGMLVACSWQTGSLPRLRTGGRGESRKEENTVEMESP